MSEAKKPFMVIMTSGSHDYLKNTSDNRRFWPVQEPSLAPKTPLSSTDRVRFNALIRTLITQGVL
jgi:predicted P-loop ATPase